MLAEKISRLKYFPNCFWDSVIGMLCCKTIFGYMLLLLKDHDQTLCYYPVFRFFWDILLFPDFPWLNLVQLLL